MNVHIQRQRKWQSTPCWQRCVRPRRSTVLAAPVQALNPWKLSDRGEASNLTITSHLPATAFAALAALTVVLPPTGVAQADTKPITSNQGLSSGMCTAFEPTAVAPCFSSACSPCLAEHIAPDAVTTSITMSALPGRAAELPWPKAPSSPNPQTPPNSPLPTPDMPSPPFIPVPPPPSQPPQLLPPHPGNEPPPQRLIPNRARSKSALAAGSRTSRNRSAAERNGSSLASAASGSSSSINGVGLLNRFRQKQGMQQQWQQVLLWAAFSEGAASHLPSQEPPSLPMPGDIPLPFLDLSPSNDHSSELDDGLFTSKGMAVLAQGSRRAMLGMYAVADTAVSASDARPAAQSAPAPTGPSDLNMKVVVPDSSRARSSTDGKGSINTQPVLSGFERNMVGVPDSFAASNKRRGPNDRDWLQQLQQTSEAVQHDPGVSDLLTAVARFADASVRLAVPLLRLLVQVAAALIQALVKLIVWGLEQGK